MQTITKSHHNWFSLAQGGRRRNAPCGNKRSENVMNPMEHSTAGAARQQFSMPSSLTNVSNSIQQ